MASFTDAISQFNPYVQQLPVEAMVEVGMQKQTQYNQGVQKIQSYIDNIAGMDVIKGEHKQYLQSKLNELGGRLRTVAAGDFSNQQLVNSVGGMATQIVKDPTVQKAVYSTQRVRKEQQRAEDAKKAGKSSKNNEDYWNDTLNTWLNDKNINTEFNGSFIEHTDVDKKLREIGETIKKTPDSIGVENPFVRDEAGKTLYFGTRQVKDPATGKIINKPFQSTDPNSGGKKEYDLDLLSIKTKGTSAQKLLNNFMDSLDSNDQQQLKIDAWAHYRGADANKFKQDITDAYTDKKDMLSQEIVDLAVHLKNPNLTDVDQLKGAAKLKDLTDSQSSGALDKELAARIAQLNTPEGLENFKDAIYTQKYISNLARDMSVRSYEEERKNNPAFQAQMEQKKFVFEQQKFIQQNSAEWARIAIAGRAQDLAEKKYKDETTGTNLEDVSSGAIRTGAPVPTIETKQLELDKLKGSQGELQTKYADRLFRGQNMTTSQKLAAFVKLKNDYDTNAKRNYTPDEIKYLEQSRNIEGQIVDATNLIASAVKTAKVKGDKMISDATNWVQVTTDSGKTYSGDEIAEVAANMNRFQAVNPIGRGSYFDDAAAAAFFKTYKGGALGELANTYIRNKSIFTKLTPKEKEVVAVFDNINNVVKQSIEQAPKTASEYLSKYDPSVLSQKATLSPETNKADKIAVDRFTAMKINQAQSVGGTTVGWSPSTLSEWETAPSSGKGAKKLTRVFEKFLNGGGQMVVSDGTSQQIVPADATEVANYFPKAAISSPFNTIKRSIETSPNKTTNRAGSRTDNPANGVNAKYTGFDLPGLMNSEYAATTRLDIEADEDNIGEPKTDGYSVIMYINTPDAGWKRKRLTKGYINEGGVMSMLMGIDKTAVQEAIKTWK